MAAHQPYIPVPEAALLAEEAGNFKETSGTRFLLPLKIVLPSGDFIRCAGEKNVVLSFG